MGSNSRKGKGKEKKNLQIIQLLIRSVINHQIEYGFLESTRLSELFERAQDLIIVVHICRKVVVLFYFCCWLHNLRLCTLYATQYQKKKSKKQK